MNRYYLSILLICLASFVIGQADPHYPSKLDSVQDLREITVTYQADRLTPVTFQNLSQAQLAVNIPNQDPSYLLTSTPSVTSYSDAGNYQGYSYFRLRGIDQTRVNITLDGIPLNEPEDQGAYLANYPDLINSLNKIQIQRGVGLSKNGSASYAGSMELSSPNLHDPSYTTLSAGYGSFNTMSGVIEYNSGVKNTTGLYVRGSRSYSDGYKYHSSNNSSSIFTSAGLYQTNTAWKLNVLAAHHQNGQAWIGVPNSLITIDRKTNGNSEAEDDDFKQAMVQLQHNWYPGLYSSFQSSVYYTHLDGNYNFDLGNYIGDPTLDELYNYAFISHLIGLYSNYTYSKGQLNTTLGVHGNLYNRQHTGSEKTYGNLYQNTGYKDEGSVYLKADYTLERLTGFADIQYRYVAFTYDGDANMDPMSWSFLNPKVGISFEPAPKCTFYYSVGSTGREPTRNDMFGGNDNLPVDSLGNGIIIMKDPERVLNQEIGYRYNSLRTNLSLSVYHMDFENEIVLDGKYGPNGLALTNSVDQSIRTGVELSASVKVGWFTLINNSSYNYSEIRDQGEVFTPILTPALIVNQEVLYSRDRLTLSVSARYQDQSFINYSNTSTLQDYILVNTHISYDITPKLSVSGYLNNVTNSKYINNGYEDWDGTNKYFTQAPINFYFMAKYSL